MHIPKPTLIAVLLVLNPSPTAHAEGAKVVTASPSETKVLSGKAYANEDNPVHPTTQPLYDVTLESKRGHGTDEITVVSTDRKGRRFLEQQITFNNGLPERYRLINRAAGTEGKLTATSEHLTFEFTRDGKTKSATEKRPRLFAVGPSITRLVEDNIADLCAYKALSLSMVVIDKLKLFDLELAREKPDSDEKIPEIRSGQWIRLRIRPSNALFSIFAPRVEFIANAVSGQVIAVMGPMPSPEPGGGTLSKGMIRYDIK